jgi:RimJ/RimL family protein N-acetyltransferase
MPATLDDLTWPVRTERLTIRRAGPSDLEDTWRVRRLPEVVEWMSSAPHGIEEYRKIFETPDRLASMLIVEREGSVIGDLMLRIEDPWSQTEVAEQARGVQAELGYCLDPQHTGHGYATEATRAMLRLCFVDLGLRRVTASCFADNVASWQVMERVGMRREAHQVRESLHRSRGWLDGLDYALLAEEWQGDHP